MQVEATGNDSDEDIQIIKEIRAQSMTINLSFIRYKFIY